MNYVLTEEIKEQGSQLKKTVPYHNETNVIIEQTNCTFTTMTQTAIIKTNKKLLKTV